MKLSIIIPAYNEKGNLEPLLDEYMKEFPEAEFILVPEGSDGTVEEAKILGKKFKNIKVRVPKKNRLGKWGAIKFGINSAHGDILGFVDSNRSVPAKSFKSLVDSMNKADCVIASRKISGARVITKQPFLERFGSFGWNILVRLVFGLDFKDTQCGAKIFKKEVVKEVADRVQTTGYAFDAEMLWRIKKAGYSISEEPIEWIYHHRKGRFSNFSMKQWPGMFLDLMKARFGSQKRLKTNAE